MNIKMRVICYISVFIAALFMVACGPNTPSGIDFEDAEDSSIFDYLTENQENYSSFISIIESAELVQALSAYNPNGTGYTLFLPDNEAVDRYIERTDRYASFDDLLEDKEFVSILARFHVINMSILTNEFPFGAFPEPSLSGDYLTVSFVLEQDSALYKINNSASVVQGNIETSNGYIHEIQDVLTPITFTTKAWLEIHEGFEIFRAALEKTGLSALVDINVKQDRILPVTVLVEPDSVYQHAGINSLEDLIAKISPSDDNYTDASNPLYNYVSYHILSGRFFMDDFVDVNAAYTTNSEVPVNINGMGLDVLINKGKQNFDTIVRNSDTTIVDYILFYYDISNVITQSGPLHFIDQVMEVKRASRANYNFQFAEEPLILEYRKINGAYEIEPEDSLQRITWEGADLFYVKLTNSETNAWNADYLETEGDFILRYRIPKVIQGSYTARLRAEFANNSNALVEVFVDNKKIGSLVDLTTGGNAVNPFRTIELGTINFAKYDEHTIEIRPLIPGRFLWDAFILEPL